MRNLKGAGCLCALLAGLSRTAAAEGTNGTEMTLPTLVVTPTREARRVEDVPYAAGLLDAETLRVALSARTVPEALAYEPGIMVQKTAHGQGSPYIRGFTSQRTLFLVDGVRLNNAVFREGPNPYWNTVDPLSLHAVEIVRGPASVLYGSDAVGGTVRAVTRGRQDALPDQDWT
ncbi:MAG: Plug domain-containing protein, partial [Lentisphaerae bacterium]|nr:Plug domain-containing protein [Lentisphaerota bacterium]